MAEFTKRPLPSEEQVEEFEEFIDEEAKEEEIDESLNEIYQDDNGDMADVKKLTIKKRRGWLYWLLVVFIGGSIISSGAYVAYSWFYLSGGTDATAFEFSISGETEVIAGEEFFYTINYKNLSNTVVTDARLEVKFPEIFVYLDSFPVPQEADGIWQIKSIPAGTENKIRIKGMMVGDEDTSGIILASIRYTPANFSSEFKKETVFTTRIEDIGMDIDINYINSALLNEENEILISFNAREKSFIKNFRLSVEPSENYEIVALPDLEEYENLAKFNSPLPGVWQVEDVTTEEVLLPVIVRFLEKTTDDQELKFVFATTVDDDNYYDFHEAILSFEVLKSDLNLTLIINGSREDQGINFGDKLNYTIVYKNKGETEMKDVVIMAVLESDFLDWTTLDDKKQGTEKGNTIAWSKTEIPELEILGQDGEGTIDFSINVMGISQVEAGLDYQVKSYAQFIVGELEEGEEEPKPSEDNRSNTIINQINSDLKLIEEVRYFSDDNLTVGNGPLPLKVGEKTSFKVYWILTNNLHELTNTLVEVNLPEYVNWDNKNRTNIGSISYNSEEKKVIWDIGRLPITVFRADAEFNISVVPTGDDANKIIVLKPGSRVTAHDSVTDTEIVQITDAKTTKLEDDPIAQKTNDGVVRE